MRNHAILLIAFTLIILACISSAYTEDLQNTSIQNYSNLNNTVKSTQTNSLYVNANTGNDSWDGTSPTYTGGKTGPFKAIQKGIDTLNKNKGGNLYIAAGEYYITSELTVEHSSHIYGENCQNTMIQGNSKTRIFKINDKINVTIEDLFINQGYSKDNGGGIYNEGILSMNNSYIEHNQGNNGGGIYNTGTLTMSHCYIEHNQGNNGGGIYNTGTVTLTNCTIDNNLGANGPDGPNGDGASQSALPGDNGGSGGGIYNTETLTITNCYIDNNAAGNGGKGGNGDLFEEQWSDKEGLHTKIVIDDPQNGGNGGNGGGIYNTGTITSITNTDISSNNAGRGGNAGSYKDEVKADLWYDVKPAKSGTGGSGGGIYSTGSINKIESSTISHNVAGNGGNGNPVSRYPAEDGGSGGNGGGLLICNPIQIINCQIAHNQAGIGGTGGNTKTGQDPSTKPGNGGNGGSGGAIYFYYSSTSESTIAIYSSTIDTNLAGKGGNGGTDDGHSSPKSSNGGNGGNGGGIALMSKNKNVVTLDIYESTISNNQAGAGGQPSLTGTSINGSGGGLYSNDNQNFNVNVCRIVNNSPQAIYLKLSQKPVNEVILTNNWWGTNNAPSNQIAGNYTNSSYYTPWIVLSINASPNSIYSNQTSHVEANLIMNSNGDNVLYFTGKHVPDGIPVSFTTNSGSFNPQNGVISNGSSNTAFTANSASETAPIYATVDNQIVNTTIQIIQSADVQMTKTVNNTRPNVGDNVTFTVTTKNNGPNGATNIQITDSMPAGFSNVEINPSTGTYNSTTGIWTIPELANGATTTLKMTGTVTKTIAGKNTTNNATKTHQDQVDPNPNNDKASASIYVPVTDIQITKIVNNNKPNVGNTVTFTITAKNNGPDNATNIQIIDIMPNGFDNCSYTASDGTSYSNGIWTISNLANGTTATLTLSGTVNSTIAGITTTNTVNKIHEDQYDSNPNNDHASASIYVPVADIHIAKTVDKNNPQVGDKVAFTVTVINDGPNNATNISISDLMPAGFNNVVITPSIGTYDNTTGIWTIPALTNGANATLILSGDVTSAIAGQLVTNTANKTAEDQYDPTPDDDTASASINTQEADVDITKTVDKNTANVGESVIFTINVTNKGPNTATRLKFLDKLPAGLQYNSNTADRGIVTIKGNYVYWNFGSLNNGETATLTINATVINSGNFTNIVRKIHEDQYDPDVDYANASIYAPEADITITNIPNNSVLDVGDNATFTVKVRNNGPDTATGVVINDTIPQGFTAHVSKGTVVGNVWTIGTLETNEEVTLTLTGVITPQWAGKTIYNNVSETQNEYNTNPKTANATITINKADLYLASTTSNPNPKKGENVKIIFKLGNKGPDTAKNATIKIPIPTGFEFINSSVDQGTCGYNESTKTLIWNVGDVAVGDPYLYLNLKAVTDGHYAIIPKITTTTYDPNLESSITPLYINVTSNNGGNSSGNKVHDKTIPLQKTGLLIIGIIVAILMVLGGLGSIRRR